MSPWSAVFLMMVGLEVFDADVFFRGVWSLRSTDLEEHLEGTGFQFLDQTKYVTRTCPSFFSSLKTFHFETFRRKKTGLLSLPYLMSFSSFHLNGLEFLQDVWSRICFLRSSAWVSWRLFWSDIFSSSKPRWSFWYVWRKNLLYIFQTLLDFLFFFRHNFQKCR